MTWRTRAWRWIVLDNGFATRPQTFKGETLHLTGGYALSYLMRKDADKEARLLRRYYYGRAEEAAQRYVREGHASGLDAPHFKFYKERAENVRVVRVAV